MMHYFIKISKEFVEVTVCEFFGYVHIGLKNDKHSVDCSSSTLFDKVCFYNSDGSLVAYMQFNYYFD